jgi:sirohydrochlorin ferrochelatase
MNSNEANKAGTTHHSPLHHSPLHHSPSTALLLIAHGSRQPDANADLHHVAAAVREQHAYVIVEPAFLELAKPTIVEAGKRCVEQGAGQVILLPYFLSAGVHVLRDLTEARTALSRQFPDVDFRLAEPLGRHPGLVEIVLQRARQAEADSKSRK